MGHLEWEYSLCLHYRVSDSKMFQCAKSRFIASIKGSSRGLRIYVCQGQKWLAVTIKTWIRISVKLMRFTRQRCRQVVGASQKLGKLKSVLSFGSKHGKHFGLERLFCVGRKWGAAALHSLGGSHPRRVLTIGFSVISWKAVDQLLEAGGIVWCASERLTQCVLRGS